MNKQKFEEYLKNPSTLNDTAVSELKQVVDAFPWFQTAHLLYAKALSVTNHYDYYSSLKRTSIAAADRKILYKLINGTDEFAKVDVEEKEPATETKPEKTEDKKEELSVSTNSDEIPFFSNSHTITRPDEVQIEKVEKQVEPLPEKLEPGKKIELQITSRVTEEKETKIERKEDPVITSPVENKPEIEPPALDQIILNPVVNAYIEKELFDVTGIHTKKHAPSAEDGFNEDSQKTQAVLKETLNEPQSFSQWLKLLAIQKEKVSVNIQPQSEKMEATNTSENEDVAEKESKLPNEERLKKMEIMDRIIQNEPGHIRLSDSPEFFNPSKSARGSNREDETLVTETLAWIYEQQGNFAKAIRAYQTLSLKNPEKSVYFAGLIQKIKQKQKQK